MSESKRRRLPDERQSITLSFKIGDENNEGTLTVGMYPDGSPGEIFIAMSKEGSTLSGMLDSLAVMISIALQHGAPIETIVNKLSGVKYEPRGITNIKCIGVADSITDFIGRFLGMKFVPLETLEGMGVRPQCKDCGEAVEINGQKYSCIAARRTRPD